MKLQLNRFNDMSPEKREPIDCLCKNIWLFDPIDTPDDEDLAEIAVRNFKEEFHIQHDYVDTRFLFPSWNRHERIFFCSEACNNRLSEARGTD